MCSAPVGEGANLNRGFSSVMLIGAHVSTAGGLDKAIERGVERGCESIQIFHQSPRMWRPTRYGEDDFAAFREAMAASPVEAVVIHAVYLVNRANKDANEFGEALMPATPALRNGDQNGPHRGFPHPRPPQGATPPPPIKPEAKK